MKKLGIIPFIFWFASAFAQVETMGLLQYKVKPEWQQQTRKGEMHYTEYNRQANTGFEIIAFSPVTAAPKPDSSFRMAWRRFFDSSYGRPNPPTVVKKRFTNSGMSFSEAGGEFEKKGSKQYVNLMVFNIEKQTQTLVFVASDAATYKMYRDFILEFMDNINPIGTRVKNN